MRPLLLMCYTHNNKIIAFNLAMNDRWTYEEELKKSNTTILAATEHIILLAREHNVAVLYLSVFMGKLSACDDMYNSVCSHYGVPLLSYRTLVRDRVKYAFSLPTHDPSVHINRTRSPVLFNVRYIEDLHPVFQSHVVIAQFVCDFFEKAFNFYTQSTFKIEKENAIEFWSRKNNPTPLFGGNIDDKRKADLVDSRIPCSPIQTFYSSLPADQPYVTSKLFHYSQEATGWVFKTDMPGKPRGWISEGNKTYGKLLLPVVVLNRQVTVTYLKSYRNSGKFHIFFQPSKNVKGNFARSSVDTIKKYPNVITCCSNPWQTNRAEIDTFDNSTRTSVLLSRTYTFDVIGTLNVVIQRVALPQQELSYRSGDKVKILSIRTC